MKPFKKLLFSTKIPAICTFVLLNLVIYSDNLLFQSKTEFILDVLTYISVMVLFIAPVQIISSLFYCFYKAVFSKKNSEINVKNSAEKNICNIDSTNEITDNLPRIEQGLNMPNKTLEENLNESHTSPRETIVESFECNELRLESMHITIKDICKLQLDIVDHMEGHEFEHYCAKLLIGAGYSNVEVTKASADQGIDVIAYKEDVKYGIQCKCYSSDIGNKAVQEAYAGSRFYNCHVPAVLTNRYFTKSAKELAQKTNVLLWDRDKLRLFIEIEEIGKVEEQ